MSIDLRRTLGPAHIYEPAKQSAGSRRTKTFAELLDENCKNFPSYAFPIKRYEAQKAWALHHSTPIAGSITTLKTFTEILIAKLKEETQKDFLLYLRGSTARNIVNLADQLESMIQGLNQRELFSAWQEEKNTIQKSPPARDTDLLLYTSDPLEMNDLFLIQEIIKEVSLECFGIVCEPFIPRKNPLNETEEPLVFTKISQSLDLVVGTMREIYNLFSIDAPALLIDTRFPFSLTSFGDNLWMGAYDSLVKTIRIEKRHESDFHAFLAGVQHKTNDATLIEIESSLHKIASKFIAKEDVTAELLIYAVRNRVLKHNVDPFSYLFNVCIYMPEESWAKRELLWQTLRKEFPTSLRLEKASFEDTATELFYLHKTYPDHPHFANLHLVFPHHFKPLAEKFTAINLRKRLECQFFFRVLNEPVSICIEGKNPYAQLAGAVINLAQKNKNSAAIDVFLHKSFEWLDILTKDQFQKLLLLLSPLITLPSDTDQNNFCERLFATQHFQKALDIWKSSHSHMNSEERFIYLYPYFFKRPKVLLQLFKEVERPSAALLLKILDSQFKDLQLHIPEKLNSLLESVPHEERIGIIQQFPHAYWGPPLLDERLFCKTDATPLLQILMNKSPSFAFLWKCEALSIHLKWPENANKEKLLCQIPQKALKQRLLYLRENLRMEEFDALYPYLQDKTAIPKNSPKLDPLVENYRRIRSLYPYSAHILELENALFALNSGQLFHELNNENRLSDPPFMQFLIKALQDEKLTNVQRQDLFLRLIKEIAKPLEKMRLYMRFSSVMGHSPEIDDCIPHEISLLEDSEKYRFIQTLAERGSPGKAASLFSDLQWKMKKRFGEETLLIIWRSIQKMEESKQFEPLQILSYIQREGIKDSVSKILYDYLMHKPLERKIFCLRNLPPEKREQLLFLPDLLPAQEQLQLLRELFEIFPKESIYWTLEENGCLSRSSHKKHLIKSRPSPEQLIKRQQFLINNRRFQECIALSIEHQGQDSPYVSFSLKQAMLPQNLISLPKLLQNPIVLAAFVDIASNDWMMNLLQSDLDRAALEALLKILKLNPFKAKFSDHLTVYFHLLLNKPSSHSLGTDLIHELLQLDTLTPMLPDLLQWLNKSASPTFKTVLEPEKRLLFSHCQDNPDFIYELLTLFKIQGIHFNEPLPDPFIDYLIMRLEQATLASPSQQFTVTLTLECLENKQISPERLSRPLLNQILRLENKELFIRWIPFCNGLVQSIDKIPIEWMIELVCSKNDTENCHLKRCLSDPDLTLEQWQKLFPHIQEIRFQNSKLLRENISRFPTEIKSVASFLIALKEKGFLKNSLESLLLDLLSKLVAAKQIDLFQDKPHLFLNTGKLAEEAMALCLPSLLDANKFQTVDLWKRLFPQNGLDCNSLVLWLFHKFKAQKLNEFHNYHDLFMEISSCGQAILSCKMLPETLLLFTKEHSKEPLPIFLQIHLCSLIKYLMEVGEVDDEIQVEFFLFLISINQLIDINKCLRLINRLPRPSLTFLFSILEYNAYQQPAQATHIAEQLCESIANKIDTLIDKEILLLIQELLLANIKIHECKTESIESTLELIYLVNGKQIMQQIPYFKELIDRTALNALHTLFRTNNPYFEKHFYAYLASKAFPPHSLDVGALTTTDTTNKGHFFALISGVVQPPPEEFHAELNNILCHLFQGFFSKSHGYELTALSMRCMEILIELLPYGKPLHCYEQAVETVLRSLYLHPASTKEDMKCLLPLFSQLVRRKKHLRDPTKLIKFELWLVGTCHNSTQKLAYWEPQLIGQIPKIIISFVDRDCTAQTESQREKLLFTLLYSLEHIEFNESQTVELYRHFIHHIKKGTKENPDALHSLILKTFNEVKIKESTKQRVLKLIN